MQFSRAAQTALPDGILGEISYRMSGPLSDGRFAEAVDSGVHVFANALAEKIGFNVAELETSTRSQPTVLKLQSIRRNRCSSAPRTTADASHVSSAKQQKQ